jgi:hypothetical protein
MDMVATMFPTVATYRPSMDIKKASDCWPFSPLSNVYRPLLFLFFLPLIFLSA